MHAHGSTWLLPPAYLGLFLVSLFMLYLAFVFISTFIATAYVRDCSNMLVMKINRKKQACVRACDHCAAYLECSKIVPLFLFFLSVVERLVASHMCATNFWPAKRFSSPRKTFASAVRWAAGGKIRRVIERRKKIMKVQLLTNNYRYSYARAHSVSTR